MTNANLADLYAGLTSIELPDDPVDLGDGVVLSRTFARFTTSFNFINTGDISQPSATPAQPDGYPPLPPPSMWGLQVRKIDVTSQIFIPASVAISSDEQLSIARLLTSALRMYADPAVALVAVSSHPYGSLIDRRLEGCVLRPLQVAPRHYSIGLETPGCNISGIQWVARYWRKFQNLYQTHAEFRLAVDALDHGQFESNASLALVGLWGAIEALFSPSTSELKFRVSALIASYLEDPGPNRLAEQKRIAALYDQRSAAAHGKPKHTPEQLLDSFELLRIVLIRMTERGAVPSKAQLEERLFGALS